MSELLLGEAIKQAREGIELTQKQLGLKLKVGESTVRMWELGKNTPSIKRIKEISRALNISSTFLLERAGYLEEGTFEKRVELARKANKAINEDEVLQKSLNAFTESHPDLHEILNSDTYVLYKGQALAKEEKEKILEMIKMYLS